MRRPGLLYLLGAIAVASVAVLAETTVRARLGITGQGQVNAGVWVLWAAGAALVALLYVIAGSPRSWEIGTREVVYMATGAALYGVLSWLTNFLPLSVGSLVSLRPAVAIPLFFGWAFGPVVGFFTGAMGNILGDFLTGWGVFPVWDLGNGLMGLTTGLFSAASGDSDSERQSAGLAHKTHHARRTTGMAVFASFVAIALGIGFAALSDIYVNGLTLYQTLTTEFLPAAGSNALMAAIFVPMLVRAWQGVQGRRGR